MGAAQSSLLDPLMGSFKDMVNSQMSHLASFISFDFLWTTGVCVVYMGNNKGRTTLVGAGKIKENTEKHIANVEGGWKGKHQENIYGLVVNKETERVRLIDEETEMTFQEMVSRTDVTFPVNYVIDEDGKVRRRTDSS